jgi:hypothetical protein
MDMGSPQNSNVMESVALAGASKALGLTLSRHGFKRSLCASLLAKGDDDVVEGIKHKFSRIPDGFHICADTGVVTVVEIEDTCKMDEAKLRDYLYLAWSIHDADARAHILRLRVFDRYGEATPFSLARWGLALYATEFGHEQAATWDRLAAGDDDHKAGLIYCYLKRHPEPVDPEALRQALERLLTV